MHLEPLAEPITIVPESCYRDAPASIAFLERAFGFAPSLVVPGVNGTIAHAELWAGNACIMLASLAVESGRWDYRVPSEIGGVNTGAPYIAVTDIDALYERAKFAGANATDLADTEYGSRDFSVRDPEGFLWYFGTYRPERPTSSASPDRSEPELYCGMRYWDAPAAIAWLCRAFGFREQFIVPGEPGQIAHAQLLLGTSVFMTGSARADHHNLKTPREIDGGYTQTLNVSIENPDEHCANAAAAGAEIVKQPADTAYGARGYVARDCEGFIWSFSTYRPVRPVSQVQLMSS